MLDPIAEQFENHLAEVNALRSAAIAKRDELRAKADAAEALLSRIELAVEVLEGKRSDANRKKSKRAAGTKQSNCTTKQEILEIVTTILGDNSAVPEEDLKGLVADQLRQRGRSLSMFANLFQKCLKSESLIQKSTGIFGLKEPSTASSDMGAGTQFDQAKRESQNDSSFVQR